MTEAEIRAARALLPEAHRAFVRSLYEAGLIPGWRALTWVGGPEDEPPGYAVSVVDLVIEPQAKELKPVTAGRGRR